MHFTASRYVEVFIIPSVPVWTVCRQHLANDVLLLAVAVVLCAWDAEQSGRYWFYY